MTEQILSKVPRLSYLIHLSESLVNEISVRFIIIYRIVCI